MPVRVRSDGREGVVIEVHDDDALIGLGGGKSFIPITDLEPLPDEPHHQLAAGIAGDSEAAFLRLLALLVWHTHRFDPGSPLSSARLEPKLHQVFVANRVMRKVAPRMILADEVGLGKTVEAGLVLKELSARHGGPHRAIVICPASLTIQWQTELRTKFNERFEIMDGDAAKHFGRGGANPFTATDRVICSLPFATQPKRVEQIREAGWDMVVFDEAHRVRRTRSGSDSRATQAYRLAESLRDEVTGLLLLSATPMQLHPFELFSLIDLVEPGLYTTYSAYERASANAPALNRLMQHIDRWELLDESRKQDIRTENARFVDRMPAMQGEGPVSKDARDRAKDELAALHPLADVMVRNRKRELNLAGERRARLEPVTPSDDEQQIYDEVTEYIRTSYAAASAEKNGAVGFLMVVYQKMLTSSSHSLRSSFERRLVKLRKELHGVRRRRTPTEAPLEAEDAEEQSAVAEDLDGALIEAQLEWEIAQLEHLTRRLAGIRDGKVRHLVRIVEDVAREGRKTVVFTQFIETQAFLVAALEANGFKATAFNGRMTADDKESAVRAFRDHGDVLVCTEAGGEGRNLQFASVLVNYDLPWNPMKVEQRIGRLDRIGQKHPVDVVNLFYEGTLEERIVRVLHDRIRLFEQSVGALDPILGTVEKTIEKMVMEEPGSLDQNFAEFADQIEHAVAEARLREEEMADLVLDRASFRKDEANRLLGRASIVKTDDVPRVIGRGLEYLGGTLAEHDESGVLINLSPRLAARLGRTRPTHRGVFDPAEAARLDDLDFYACGHPLVDKILTTMESLDSADVGARMSPDVPAGTWVEVLWRVKATLSVTEGKIIRHLIGPDLEVRSSELTALPLGDEPIRCEIPDWASEAVAASEARFQAERRTWRDEYRREWDAFQAGRLARLDRLHEGQRQRLELDVARDAEWIDTHSGADARPEDRRILPARRKQLENRRRRLADLSTEHEQRRREIEAARLSFEAEVVAASLVVGR